MHSAQQNQKLLVNNKNTQSSAPSEKTFRAYYEQTIKLRKELQDKKQYIQQLKQKLQTQINLNRTIYSPFEQPKGVKKEVNKNRSIRPQSTNKNKNSFYNTATNIQNRKVQSLLEIIQNYKFKLQKAELQSAELRRKKYIVEQELQLKKNIPHQDNNIVNKSHHINQSRQQQIILTLEQKIKNLENQRQNAAAKDAQIRKLKTENKIMIENHKNEIKTLNQTNEKYEERIMNLTRLNRNSQIDDFPQTKKNQHIYQNKYKAAKVKIIELSKSQTQLQVGKRVLQGKCTELSYEIKKLQEEVINLKKNQLDHPIIKKLMKDPALLIKTVAEIQKPKSLVAPVQNPQQYISRLVSEKEQLAKELQSTRSKIKVLQDNEKEKDAMIKIEKQQIIANLSHIPLHKGKKVFTSNMGVPYDGDISMFTDEKSNIPNGVNYFDIYLGELNLLQTMVKSMTKLINSSNPLILATVDFYNFKTVSTKMIQGCQCDLRSEFNFKVSEDEFFFKFLNKGSFKVSFCASQNNKQYALGQIQIPLKSLFLNNKPSIAPVINTSAPIFLNQKVMGTIRFDMRIRLPIYDQTSKIPNLSHLMAQQDQTSIKKKLIIQIQQGHGFRQSSNLFVYYPFRFQDFYTKISKGPNPKWSHYKLLEVNYNSDLQNYLGKNQLEFVLFDDNAILYDDRNTDVVGSGSISLKSLMQDQTIKKRLQIKKNGNQVGIIDVKIFWYQQRELIESTVVKKQQDFMITFHKDIKKYIKDNDMTPEKVFRRIDDNNTGIISREQFLNWVTKVKKSHKYSQELLINYYNSFSQPLNQRNWIKKLSQDDEQNKNHIMPQISSINNLLQKNSEQIHNQISLQQYLRHRNLLDITLALDDDGNGKITKKQFLTYMQKNNVKITPDQVPEDIRLVDFIKKYKISS